MKNLLDISGAFYDETRILVAAFLLAAGECCVCEIAASLKLGQSRLSRHLKILEDAGILISRRDKKMVFYNINPNANGLVTAFLKEVRNLKLNLPQKIYAFEILKEQK